MRSYNIFLSPQVRMLLLSCISKCCLNATMVARLSLTEYSIIRSASTSLKFSGTEILVVSSYHKPNPFCESDCHGKFTLGSFFLVGAISAWPIKFAAGILYAFLRVANTVSKLFICAGGKESNPLLSSSMPMDDEFTSLSFPQELTPACHARR